MFSCKDCPKYKKCTKLCKSAKDYVKQDEVNPYIKFYLTGSVDVLGNLAEMNNFSFQELQKNGNVIDMDSYEEIVEKCRLTDIQSSIIYYRYVEGKTFTEIGKILRKNSGSIFSAHSFAMKKIHRYSASKYYERLYETITKEFKPKKKLIYRKYFIERLTQIQVSDALGLSTSRINYVIKEIQNKIENKCV